MSAKAFGVLGSRGLFGEGLPPDEVSGGAPISVATVSEDEA